MAKTIHTLAYMITADTRSLTSGMTLTRKEVSLTKAIMESSVTPAQRYADSLAAIQAVHAKGAKFDLAEAIKKLNEEFAVTAEVVDESARPLATLKNYFSTLNPLTASLKAGMAGWAAGLAAVAAVGAIVVLNVRSQITAIDDLLASASTIGVSAKSFQVMAHAAGLADVEIGSMSKGIESMLSNVSKAAGGSTKLTKVFDLIGLDAKELKTLRPEDQVQQITNALNGMANVSDRVRAATAIFGSADFLRINTTQVEHANQLIEQLGGGLTELDEAAFNEFDDAVKDMNLSLDVSWKKLTMQVIPALGDAAEAVTEMLIAMNQSTEFNAALDQIGSKLQIAVAIAKEMPAAIDSWLPSIDTVQRGLESTNPRLGLLGRAVGMAVGAAGGSDLTSEQARGSELDNALAARKAEENKALEEQKRIIEEEVKVAKELAPAFESAAAAMEQMRSAGTDLVANLQQQIATFGMTARQADIFKAAQMGASIASIVTATALDQELTKKEEMKKANEDALATMKRAHEAEQAEIKKAQDALKSEATSAIDSLKSPFDVAMEEIERFREMMNADLINEDQFSKLSEKSIDKFRGSQKQEEFRNPAMLRGSQEAIAAVVNARFGTQNQTDKMVDLLEDIAENTDEDAVDMPVISSFGGG